MKRHGIITLAAVLTALLTLTFSATGVLGSENTANTVSFPIHFVEVNVPENVLVMTPDTPKNDPVWAKAGIIDPKTALDDFETMGTFASFYDTASGETVNLLAKKSTETVKKFSFAGLSDNEIVSYVTEVTGSPENTTVEVSMLEHSQVPFFRLKLVLNSELSHASEIVYGSLVNGQMIQLDIYRDGTGEIDETFAGVILSNLSFTKLMTREEYDESSAADMRKFFLVILAVVVFFGGLIVIAKLLQERSKKQAARISEAMREFRERDKAGLVDRTKAPLFTLDFNYTDATINDFAFFSMWFKSIFALVFWGVIFLGLEVFMFLNDELGYGLLTFAIGVAAVYFTYTKNEKNRANLKARYNTKASPNVSVRFFDEYFTVYGLGSVSEYIYRQVTSVRTFKTYIYLFLGSEQAIMIDFSKIDPDITFALKKHLSNVKTPGNAKDPI